MSTSWMIAEVDEHDSVKNSPHALYAFCHGIYQPAAPIGRGCALSETRLRRIRLAGFMLPATVVAQ